VESNWRFNVWETGWSHSGFRLIASLVTPYLGFVTIALFELGGRRFIRFSNQPVGAYISAWTGLTSAGNDPFPFGFEVEPD